MLLAHICVCVCVCLSGCQELRHRELISRRERVDQNTSFNTVKQQNKLKRQLSLIDDIQSVMTQRGPYSVFMCLRIDCVILASFSAVTQLPDDVHSSNSSTKSNAHMTKPSYLNQLT